MVSDSNDTREAGHPPPRLPSFVDGQNWFHSYFLRAQVSGKHFDYTLDISISSPQFHFRKEVFFSSLLFPALTEINFGVVCSIIDRNYLLCRDMIMGSSNGFSCVVAGRQVADGAVAGQNLLGPSHV